jgi:hypothetical protein
MASSQNCQGDPCLPGGGECDWLSPSGQRGTGVTGRAMEVQTVSKELYQLAAEGDLDALLAAMDELDSDSEPTETMYQWLQVAACLGHEQADEMASDLEEAMDRGGAETMAMLNYEVACWFIEGENGVERNIDHGLDQLAYAQQLQLRESIDLDKDLLSLRAQLDSEQRQRFDEIFPGLA